MTFPRIRALFYVVVAALIGIAAAPPQQTPAPGRENF